MPLSVSPTGSKYYEKDALLADPVFGPILACLLGEPKGREASAGPVGASGQVQGHRLSGCVCLHSGALCLGVHQAQDSRSLLDRPFC